MKYRITNTGKSTERADSPVRIRINTDFRILGVGQEISASLAALDGVESTQFWFYTADLYVAEMFDPADVMAAAEALLQRRGADIATLESMMANAPEAL